MTTYTEPCHRCGATTWRVVSARHEPMEWGCSCGQRVYCTGDGVYQSGERPPVRVIASLHTQAPVRPRAAVQVNGERLTELRLARGISVCDLALMISMSHQSVNNAQRGRRLGLTLLSRLAGALGVSVSELEARV